VLFVLYATRKLVFLNNFVMALVWLPMYVKVTHFCFCVVSVVLFVLYLLLCINVWDRYPLLCNIVSINCASLCLLSCCSCDQDRQMIRR
jgi:hypothetical protein